mmetsp:Transcript_7074/g.28949  ORF Transcript_7074/g.28949 Transcript_7074/m.28949 type:complete len:284 (-) Transcript_7074:11-862(-)|eukprot:PRCOL_00000315-RA
MSYRGPPPARIYRQFLDFAKEALATQALSPGDALVELCCGTGPDAGKWERAGISKGLFLEPSTGAGGTEQAKAALGEAKGRWEAKSKKYAADFEIWDGTADNLPPEWLGAADAVTCHMRISEYLRDEQTAAHFFQTAAALLKPGGLLYGVMLDQAAVWTAAQKGKVEVKGQGQKTRSRAFTLFLESDSFEPEYFGTPFLLRAEDGLGDKVAHFLGHIPSIVAVAEAAGLEMVEMVQMTEFYEDHRHTPVIAKLLEARKLDKGAVAECFDLIGLHTTYCFKKRS